MSFTKEQLERASRLAMKNLRPMPGWWIKAMEACNRADQWRAEPLTKEQIARLRKVVRGKRKSRR